MNTILNRTIVRVFMAMLMMYASAVQGLEPEYFLLQNEITSPRFNVSEPQHEAMLLSHQSLAGIVLNQSTLEDVERVFGTTRRIPLGHGGVLMCYRSANRRDLTIATFSGGVMNVPTVSGFQLVSGVEDYQRKAKCGVSGLVSRELHTSSGLGLDLPQRDFEYIWGGATTKVENHILASYHSMRVTKAQGGQELCVLTFSDMRSRFRSGKLSWLMIETVEEADFNITACDRDASN